MHIIDALSVINSINTKPIIDVRSEDEYLQGHIPGALNIPLLNNENRKLVGICYKEKGNEAAVLLGYELVGPEFAALIRKIKNAAPEKNVIIHCWRGGLRSRIVAQLLENSGYQVSLLKGGYKTYRHWVLQTLDRELPLHVVGGLTGCGKTELLKQLELSGEQIIDLEGLAHHKGSAFGGIGQIPQPTQEQFENNLSYTIKELNTSKPIWIEDESRKIGTLCLPLNLWEKMRNVTLYEIHIPQHLRLQRIVNEYACLPKVKLEEKTKTLRKRLGDLRTNEVLQLLSENRMTEWSEALLLYYDKNYAYGQSKRNLLQRIAINLPNGPDAALFLNELKRLEKQKGAKAPQ